MSVVITIEVPETLGQELAPYHDRLTELLELGLRAAEAGAPGSGLGIEDIIELLVSRPTPEQILAITPSTGLQNRMSALLESSKIGALTKAEAAELERYLMLEHLVRLAKSRAYQNLSAAQ